MESRKTYLRFFLPFLILLTGLGLWQAEEMIKEERKDRQIWLVTGENPKGEISQEVLFSMKEFPGLERIWTVIQADAQMKVENYQTSVTVQGVDLTSYPLTVAASAGQKRQGGELLLAAGEDFFRQLEDGNEIPISERQALVLMEGIKDLEAELTLSGEKTEDGEAAEEEGSKTGAFLGALRETGVYMDQMEMKKWLGGQGIHPEVSKVCLEIRGKDRADRAVESLEKAGFLADGKRREDGVEKDRDERKQE